MRNVVIAVESIVLHTLQSQFSLWDLDSKKKINIYVVPFGFIISSNFDVCSLGVMKSFEVIYWEKVFHNTMNLVGNANTETESVYALKNHPGAFPSGCRVDFDHFSRLA